MDEMKRPIPRILFDTDIGGDCDDAGALAMLHRLCDRGECELLAVTACYASPHVAGCIDAINRYYGHSVPVGILHGKPSAEPGVYAKGLCEEFENSYPPENTDRVPDTVAVMRRVLAQAEDHSITLAATGSMASLAALVQSPADAYSPLDGGALIAKKVLRTVVMGGRFFGSWPMPIVLGGDFTVTWEWNIKADIPAAQIMCRTWPGELIFSSYEIGLWCVTMKGYAQKAPKEDPVRRAYELHPCGRDYGRESWDHTALLYAVRPDAGYWNLHPFGRVTVDDGGVTEWHEEAGGMQSYLLPREDYAVIRDTINELVFTGTDEEN
ncbi:MAG: hypothetical protein E7604_11860 [Ruminococcaceae bacterium]|nr:hypothetical protein [Oscillospiraceae bacterium]